MDAVAFELRSDLQGSTTVEHADGSTEEVPTFGGGLLAVGDGDFDVAEELDKGDGAIVVLETDNILVDLLEEYPALKRCAVPDKAKPVSKYARLSTETLRHQASLRDITGPGGSKAKLVKALERQDRELAAGQPVTTAAVDDEDEDVDEDSSVYDEHNKDDLLAEASERELEIPSGATKADVITALEADDDQAGNDQGGDE